MELIIAIVVLYFCIGIALLLHELYRYPDDTADLHELISASIVCAALWPWFVIWCVREWWRTRDGQ